MRAIAVTCAAFALVASGCGDDSDEAFRDEYGELNGEIDELGIEVHAALQDADAKSGPQVSRQFTGLALALAELQGRVGDLEAPADLDDDVDKLEEAMGAVASSLRDLGEAANGGSSRRVRLDALALLRRAERLDALQQSVEEKADSG